GFSTEPVDDSLQLQQTLQRTGNMSGYDLYKEWISPGFPRMIVVTFQHPTVYFDDSYVVNSANNGPYGDAIMTELIPISKSTSASFASRMLVSFPGGRPEDGNHSPFRSFILTFSAALGPFTPIPWTSPAISSWTFTTTITHSSPPVMIRPFLSVL